MRIKSYISYSQFVTWKAGPEAYRKAYIFGYQFSNKYTKFGSKIHEALELRKAEDEDGRTAISIIPMAQRREVVVERTIRGVPLFIRMDGTYKSRVGYAIKEYKTSKNGWTQAQVDRNEQLTFYVAVWSAKLKVPVNEIRLVLECVRTFEDNDGTVHLTGQKQRFETWRTRKEVNELLPKVKKAWIGIEKLITEASKIK